MTFVTGKISDGRSTFRIVCVLCGIVAFVQLMMMGVALATRVGETRVVEKIVEGEPVVVRIPTLVDRPDEVTPLKARSYEQLLKDHGNTPIDTAAIVYQKRAQQNDRNYGVAIKPLDFAALNQKQFGTIKDPKVEKLIEESMKLHLKGDVVRAVVKLDEAEVFDPNEPAIIYRRALIYEDMRNWERAAEAYYKLYELGPSTGKYYKIASDKIANGVKDPPDIVPFQFGTIRQQTDPDKLRAQVTIPIRKITDRSIEPSKMEVRIFFYDIVDNKTVQPVPKQREQNIAKRWLTAPADWSEGNEEVIEAIYQLPQLSEANVHLFGDRKYFGHVVELYYKGELMDQVASPGRLHGIHAAEQFKHQIQPDMLPYNEGDLLPTEPDGPNMLLPTLDE